MVAETKDLTRRLESARVIYMDITSTPTRKATKCHNCGQTMTKKLVTKAIDSDEHVAEYGTFDDERVWVTKDGKAMCHTHGIAHHTTKEWYSAQ